jgi:hypothetical protein
MGNGKTERRVDVQRVRWEGNDMSRVSDERRKSIRAEYEAWGCPGIDLERNTSRIAFLALHLARMRHQLARKTTDQAMAYIKDAVATVVEYDKEG